LINCLESIIRIQSFFKWFINFIFSNYLPNAWAGTLWYESLRINFIIICKKLSEWSRISYSYF
jgi:hypothetical protein